VGTEALCDLHVHSPFSTDSGNYALRRAGLGESFSDPERVYRVCKRRGMRFVTISDHNTVEGALRIAHLPDTFLSVEMETGGSHGIVTHPVFRRCGASLPGSPPCTLSGVT
jgi:predicted metal-dependent phosphoesterase TrpH